jgi:RNA polymerase sigma-70 factor (ECF subfamily)
MRQVTVSDSNSMEMHLSEDFMGLPDSGAAEGRTSRADVVLVERLKQGDEATFSTLIEQYHGSLIRLAMAHVSDHSVAEEVVQETWLAVVEGVKQFEGRSSLKTWIFRILTNKAKTRGVRESRHVSVSMMSAVDDHEEPAVDPSRFRKTGHWADYWEQYPQSWDDDTPERCLLTKEGTTYLERAIQSLPGNLREVLVLRDVEGLSSKEVCSMLAVTEVNQRVLLHRARSRVRQALEEYVRNGIRPL